MPYRRIGPATTDTCVSIITPVLGQLSTTLERIPRVNPIADFNITITGTNFNQNSSQLGCLIDGRYGVVLDVSLTSVTCQMPTGTYTPGYKTVIIENLVNVAASRSNQLSIYLWSELHNYIFNNFSS